MGDRTLRWDGLVNGRDMAGIEVAGGAKIAPRRLVRSASPHRLTEYGWRQCVSHGVRSTLDLRHDWETEKASPPVHLRPPEVEALTYSVEPPGFIDLFRATGDEWQLATPLYYDGFVDAWGERLAATLLQIVNAPAGGVLVHCFAGRDRAGLIMAVLLDLLGASPETIISDHWMSFDRAADVESTLDLPSMSGGILPLSQQQHGEILTGFLAKSPADRALGADAAAIRDQLRLRLVH